MNVFRRHLTPEQRRWQIKQVIMRAPQASDREIARQQKVDHKTVGAVRAEMKSGLIGEIPQRDHPLDRAKSELRKDPALTKRALMEKAGVTSNMAVKARREIAAEPPPAREEPKPMVDNDREFAAASAAAPLSTSGCTC